MRLTRLGQGRSVATIAALCSMAASCNGGSGGAGDASADVDSTTSPSDTGSLSEVPIDAGAADDTAATDSGDADVSADTDETGCDPTCHWDCGGGAACTSGFVNVNGLGPRPCCKFDPSLIGVACVAERVPCGGACPAVPDDETLRVQRCINGFGTVSPLIRPDETRLLCGKRVSIDASCASNDDCRPATPGLRLVCDTARARCVAVGADAGPDASSCPDSGCTTAPCVLDDDCPAGQECTCWGSSRICRAPAGDAAVDG